MEGNYDMVSLRHFEQGLFHVVPNSGDDGTAPCKVESLHRGNGRRVQINFAREKSFGIRKTRSDRNRLDLDALEAGVRQQPVQCIFVAESEDIHDCRHPEAALDDMVECFVERMAIEGLPDVQAKTAITR